MLLQIRPLVLTACFTALGFALCSSAPFAQEKKPETKTAPPRRPPPIISPEVSADGKVTFRVRAPNAKEVSASGEMSNAPVKLVKDEEGVWSAIVGPLPPEVYTYSVTIDGVRTADPHNSVVQPSRSPVTSIFDIPGTPPLLHDFQKVPHGTLHIHSYASKVTGSLRRMHVYTPPNYDKAPAATFPTLYLFHGSGDTDGCWTVLGRAHWIVDNLIAQGKAKPMVIVMPDGHARLAGGDEPPRDGPNRNLAFEKDLLEEVLPFVEANYRVKPDRENRAIIGLSMGGGQSLGIGLKHPELFAWVGGMSSSFGDPKAAVPGMFADPSATNKSLRLLWTACGRDDRLVAGAREFAELLDKDGIHHQYVETDGGHSWNVWRKYLAQFVPLLFVDQGK